MSKLYFRGQKNGIAVELWHNDWLEPKGKLEIKVFTDEFTFYMSPTRAKNLLKMLESAIEHLPKKSDEL